MLSISMHVCSELLSPLNNVLMQTVLGINNLQQALLQLTDATKLIPFLLKPKIA